MKVSYGIIVLVLIYLVYKNTEHFWFESRTNLINNSIDYTDEVQRTEYSKSTDLLPAGSECESDSNCTPGLKCGIMVKKWNAAYSLGNNEFDTKDTMRVCKFASDESCSDFGRPSTNCF